MNNEPLDLGLTYYKNGEYGACIELMTSIIARDPFTPAAYWYRALALYALAQTPEAVMEAIADVDRCIIYAPDPVANAYGRRGIWRFSLMDYDGAISDLDTAIGINNYWGEALYFRARTLIALNRGRQDTENALRDIEDAIRYEESPASPFFFWRAFIKDALGLESDAVSDYLRAIELDPKNVMAMNSMGYNYDHGVGVEQSRERAFEFYLRAAELGFPVAQNNTAFFYRQGFVSPVDLQKAFYWYNLSAEQNDPVGLYNLGRMYEIGEGTQRNNAKAAELYERASQLGHVGGIFNLAECYEYGKGLPLNEGKAFELYSKLASSGIAFAQYQIGRFYYYGKSVPQSYENAVHWYRLAAASGNSAAQNSLACCYDEGRGVTVDKKKAISLFKASAADGNAFGCFNLARRYERGADVPKNVRKALRLFEISADNGFHAAYYRMGHIHCYSLHDFDNAERYFRLALSLGIENVESDLAAALLRKRGAAKYVTETVSLLESGVANGSMFAAFSLAEILMWGRFGLAPDPARAVRLLMEASNSKSEGEANYPCAVGLLGRAFELGLGVGQDEAEAVRLFRKAEDISRARGGCSCFQERLIHAYRHGIGVKKSPENALGLAKAAVESSLEEVSDCLIMYYAFLSLESECGEDTLFSLKTMLRGVLRRDPHEITARHLLYITLCRLGERRAASRCLSQLSEEIESSRSISAALVKKRILDKQLFPVCPMPSIEDLSEIF